MNAELRLVEPRNVDGQVAVRRSNAKMRKREYLLPAEIEKLIKAAKQGRWGHRDATLILVAYRHGLRLAASQMQGFEQFLQPWSSFGQSRVLVAVNEFLHERQILRLFRRA
jgi:hypothetical protein